MQHLSAFGALRDCESRVHLPAESVAGAIDSSGLLYEANGEASFAIDETDYPVN